MSPLHIGHHFWNWDRSWNHDLGLRLRLTRETGYEGFESKPRHLGQPPEVVREHCAELGIRCAAVGGEGSIKETIDYAHLAGAGIARCGVPREECGRWVDYAGERGILITMHPHLSVKNRGRGAVETREDLLQYLDGRPGVLGCPDTGHLLLCGSDTVQTIRDLGERCAYVHLKDIDPAAVGKADGGGTCFWELGTGALDLPGVMSALEAVGHDGWIMVERDSRVPDYEASARRMRDLLHGLGY